MESSLRQPRQEQEEAMSKTQKELVMDAGIIAQTLEDIDNRAICADGPVTPTLKEATYQELRRIYLAAKRIQAYARHAKRKGRGKK
jgi:hypothetical protein